ncbi:MAG: HD domain-containing protein [Bacteroidales bacterium]|nr:HD domain-containing protein [Bacteroidales bacterium]
MRPHNKRKIINDPVYGFITLPDEAIFDIIEHRYFQRLRRIKQLGLTHLVYPGALHTRFHHVIGAMNLMMQAVEVLRSKGNEITGDEALGVYIAILLHDAGHGPYSHTLESLLVYKLSHEELSLLFMKALKIEIGDVMNVAIAIFEGNHPKKFLHQLVSGQLDMDRLDYLKRDSFFTGVSEGVINTDRIIKMLDVVDDGLVVEAKGIYSIDKFIVARRLMYWQVYLHKTVLAAEHMLVNIIRRARYLAMNGEHIFTTSALRPFLNRHIGKNEFENDEAHLENFAGLDDFDVYTSIKEWVFSKDKVLSTLCKNLVQRNLFRTEILSQPVDEQTVVTLKKSICSAYGLSADEAAYFIISDEAHNSAYNPLHDRINILFRNGIVKNYSDVSDQINASVLSKTIVKYFVCYPKEFDASVQF